MPPMEEDTNSVDDSIEFCDWRGVRSIMKVPRRFKSPDIEIEFGRWLAKRGERYMTNALAAYIGGIIISGLSLREDFAKIDQRAPASSWMVIGWSVMFIVAVLMYLLGRTRPHLFTERRRVAFAVYVILAYHIAGNRSAVVSFLGISWPYSGKQAQPQQVWSAMVLMIVASGICNTVFSRCSTSWVVYPVALIISIGFSIPHVVVGDTTIYQAVVMLGFVCLHVHIVFLAQASAEQAERWTFAHMVESRAIATQERVLRYTAERQAEEALPPPIRQRTADEVSAVTETTDLSSAAFYVLHNDRDPQAEAVSLQAIQLFGEEEHWLIEPEDLQLLPACTLGVGGFGSVVAGMWKQAHVAVKVPAERGTTRRNAVAPELRVLRKLRHPNVVSFLGACIDTDEGEWLIVEELVIGEALSKMFAHLGAFAVENSRLRQHILLDISAALHYLHGQTPAITHGDLTPGNVMVEYKTCKMKLTDFGLSRRVNTRDTIGGGTTDWLEPVLRCRNRGSVAVHTGTDIWALRAVSFFVCSGLEPSRGSRIYGSTTFEGFGRAVQDLWAGPSAESENSRSKRIELADPEDLEDCRSLCISCMNPVKEQRPTARSVHEQVLAWKQSQGRSRFPMPGTIGRSQQADTLLADLEEVREHARELRSSRLKQVQLLPKDACDQLYDELLALAKRLRALPSISGRSDVVQTMQIILEMVSWKMQDSEVLCL
eukprot:TRINITY_DN87731_c0_g1_i1.p1 TRINITY_DN87731_c0_g1~~TRINITY_DN87731_c0_g1_i1.p1  ORF type:complete len:726 (-),score=84.54 TRINITY_DN87731_c0_g1_i1:142-2283(-)